MKTFIININSKLKDIEITVKNGAKFTRDIIKGKYSTFKVEVNEADLKRIKKYAVKYGNDNNSCRGSWYAHCNGYSMDLVVNYLGEVSINTYAEYRKDTLSTKS